MGHDALKGSNDIKKISAQVRRARVNALERLAELVPLTAEQQWFLDMERAELVIAEMRAWRSEQTDEARDSGVRRMARVA